MRAGKEYMDLRVLIQEAQNIYRTALTEAEYVRRSTAVSTAYMGTTAEQHKAQFQRQMRKFFGVKIDVLDDSFMGHWMRERVQDNVNLIVTIKGKTLAQFRDDLIRVTRETPFDHLAIRGNLEKIPKHAWDPRWGTLEYKVRRITRDQPNKAIGDLNRIRQRQAGITHYIWQTVGDRRVRETHSLLDGETFSWQVGSHLGHPGQPIQCRCVAIPILPEEAQRYIYKNA